VVEVDATRRPSGFDDTGSMIIETWRQPRREIQVLKSLAGPTRHVPAVINATCRCCGQESALGRGSTQRGDPQASMTPARWSSKR